LVASDFRLLVILVIAPKIDLGLKPPNALIT
jgi:hypothetical protein